MRLWDDMTREDFGESHKSLLVVREVSFFRLPGGLQGYKLLS